MSAFGSQLPAGTRLAEYEIQLFLGQGGFGITYAAFDWHLRCHRAIKELLPVSVATRERSGRVAALDDSAEPLWEIARKRFIKEAGILKSFDHPSIVKVHRLLETNNTLYMVMDYVPGSTLESLLAEEGGFASTGDALALLEPMLEGLAAIHARRFYHLDIKPQNVLVDENGHAVLIDFGAARHWVGEKTSSNESFVTSGYSPLELYGTTERVGPWTDIYSVGAMMHRAIVGTPPPAAPDRANSYTDPYQSLAERAESRDHDPAFLRAIDWSLRLGRKERPGSVADWREAFRKDGTRGPRHRSATEADASATLSDRKSGREISEPRRQGGGDRLAKGLVIALGFLIILGIVLAVIALLRHYGQDAGNTSVSALIEPRDSASAVNRGVVTPPINRSGGPAATVRLLASRGGGHHLKALG